MEDADETDSKCKEEVRCSFHACLIFIRDEPVTMQLAVEVVLFLTWTGEGVDSTTMNRGGCAGYIIVIAGLA